MTVSGIRARADADLYRYRPDLDPANAGVRSWVYLFCLDPPYKHAKHYAGSARDLAARMARQGTCQGARLLEVQREAGGSWHIVRTWPGGKFEERAIKEWKNGPKLCPDCSPGNQRGSMADLARAAQRIRDRYALRYGDAGLDTGQVLADCSARGREQAARFLSLYRDATADELEQAAAALQTRYYEGTRTPDGDAENGAFADVITAALARRRAAPRLPQAAALTAAAAAAVRVTAGEIRNWAPASAAPRANRARRHQAELEADA